MTREYCLQLINEGINKVRDFNITVTIKAGHKSKLYEVKNLYNELMAINPYLFEAQYNYEWSQYKLNLETGRTKKELDNNLHRCIAYLHRQLKLIENDIYNNEIKFDN